MWGLAYRKFLMQLNRDNKDMEILTYYETRTIIKLSEVLPNWWGDKRYSTESWFRILYEHNMGWIY